MTEQDPFTEFMDDLVKWASSISAPDHPEFEQGYRAAIADVKAAAEYRRSKQVPDPGNRA